MSRLELVGKLIRDGDDCFVSVHTGSKPRILPVRVDSDTAGGCWVHFVGKLCTESYWDSDLKRNRKRYYAEGELLPVRSNKYFNRLTIDGGTVVRVGELRTTPLTQLRIVDFVIAKGDNYYDCIVFGEEAERLLATKRVGSRINVTKAQFHSREYEKEGETRIAYEVSIRDYN